MNILSNLNELKTKIYDIAIPSVQNVICLLSTTKDRQIWHPFLLGCFEYPKGIRGSASLLLLTAVIGVNGVSTPARLNSTPARLSTLRPTVNIEHV